MTPSHRICETSRRTVVTDQQSALLGLLFMLVLQMQLLRSSTLDAYEMIGTRADLIGYAFCQIFGLVTILVFVTRRAQYHITLYYGLALISYILLIAFFTAPGIDFLGITVSRYGIVNWFLIGVGFARSLEFLRRTIGANRRTKLKWAAMALLTIVSLWSLQFSYVYLTAPSATLRYQSVANNLIILLVSQLLFIEAVWQENKPFPLILGFIAMGTILAITGMRMQSTLLPLVWSVIWVVFILFASTPPRKKSRWIWIGVSIISILAMRMIGIIDYSITNTRFDGQNIGIFDISSLNSRMGILESFSQQFMVSPVFGNFQAEIYSGVGEGYYLHSIILSFLTHTGLVGTTLLAGVFWKIFHQAKNASANTIYNQRLLVALFLIGCLTNFLTWPVLWFILGFMCMPNPPCEDRSAPERRVYRFKELTPSSEK